MAPAFPGLVQAEAWAMHVASCVTDAARVAVLELPDGAQALCVERFDRTIDETGGIARIHQEDCAQEINERVAPGRNPSRAGAGKPAREGLRPGAF